MSRARLSITWQLVIAYPSGVTTKPEPAPLRPSSTQHTTARGQLKLKVFANIHTNIKTRHVSLLAFTDYGRSFLAAQKM
jgi:hypothetical protein